MNEKNRQWLFADGLRGLACLIVVVLHGASAAHGIGSYIRGVPKTGVWLFFVLSAFLLTRKMIASDKGPNGRRLAGYVISRFLRIYPMYALALVAYLLSGAEGIESWETVGESLLLESGPLHFWTIPPEFKFYLILPFLIPPALWLRRAGRISMLVGTVAAVISHQLIWPYYDVGWNSLSVVDYLPVFAFGVAVATLVHDDDPPRPRRLFDYLALALVAAFLLATPFARHFLFGQALGRDLLDKFVFYGAGWALLVWLVCNGATITRRVFELRILVAVGKASFPIYLIHWLIQREMDWKFESAAAEFTIALAASLALGFILHGLVERPVDRLRHWVEKLVLQRQPKVQLGVSQG